MTSLFTFLFILYIFKIEEDSGSMKILLGIVLYFILAFIYSALVVAHRCDEEDYRDNN